MPLRKLKTAAPAPSEQAAPQQVPAADEPKTVPRFGLFTKEQQQPPPASPASPSAAAVPEKTSRFSLFRRKPAKPDEQTKKTPVQIGKTSSLKKFIDSLNNIGLGREKTHFIENLAILLNSGLTVIDALKTIELETKMKGMKRLIGRVIEEVESGIALWRAMDNQNFFSAYALALIRIGEESGALSRNMEYLSVQQEKNRALKSKVKMAMIYPSIVLVMTAVITLGLAWFVLPQLVGVLLSLNAELPLATRIIILIADFFKLHGSVAVPLFVAFGVLVMVLCKYTSLRGPSQQMVMYVPGIGALAFYATIAQFGVILGSLLKAGVPLLESIRSMADVTDMVYYRRFFFRLADEIEVGQSFAKSFARLPETNKLIPISVQQLIITGEQSGKLGEMMLRIANIYEKKAEESATRLPIILEPMLLLFIGGLVGTIAFAIIVPIYSIVGSVGR